MGWLIIRIEPQGNLGLPEKEREPPVEQLARRHALRQPEPRLVGEVLDRAGYVLGPIVGAETKPWPLTAVVYTSPRKDGYGRAGSQFWCWPVRRKEDGE